MDIWSTDGQRKYLDSFRIAVKEKCIIALCDYSGTGFKHSLRYFSRHNSDVRIVFVKISKDSKNKELGLTMLKQLMTIRFNNFKYIHPTIFDIFRVLGDRVKQDLKGKKILIVFENLQNITTDVKLSRFMNLIKRITFPCGIVLRFERSYYDKVERWGDERLLNEFKDFTEKRRFIERNSPEDIMTFCQIHGLSDYSLLQEIKTKTLSFTIAMQSVKKFKAYKPPGQLSLFGENLVR